MQYTNNEKYNNSVFCTVLLSCRQVDPLCVLRQSAVRGDAGDPGS